MKVLFLDIDGVLNTHDVDPDVRCGQIHGEKVMILNGILRATEAKIVLSSAWRYIVHRGEANLKGMEWLLRSHGILADRLIGVTRPDTMVARCAYDGVPGTWPVDNERGQQITDWLESRQSVQNAFARVGPKTLAAIQDAGVEPVASYVVLDDMDLGISATGHPFVQIDGAIGLTVDDAMEATRMLQGVCLAAPTPEGE